MARTSGADFNLVGPLTERMVGLQPGFDRRAAEFNAARFGNQGTPSPAGLRQLSEAEKAHGDVFTWSPELGTYTCPHFPQGIEP